MDNYSSSSSVDCTLSLATPSSSTRASCGDFAYDSTQSYHPPPESCYYGWDFLGRASKYKYSAAPSDEAPNTCRRASRGTGSINAAGYNISSPSSDPLLARRCANCDTTSTPLWRNGPRGPKSLCNACGIRFKKEARRASAAAASNVGASSGMEAHHYNWWTQKMISDEFGFVRDENGGGHGSHSNIAFLSWKLNVTDRLSLVHDFTR